ncbi:MAG: arginine--tRNA ligase [Candidatus Diapherotrites archaeon]|jgi:arginyl-tRNA synthetase|uniref:Arginine--tRNA ligase n=1 Tax=Candidatus Iainarchaeum sp. TaxID=3101447 RepID=A0A8T5GE19_9ARCH|nr:arginine--tRNA ligase [Candidatus Diapherotrites archaeon]MBT7241015.1 arginine--tRNA ligase [Candidatus Diapherotrites archaeon]
MNYKEKIALLLAKETKFDKEQITLLLEVPPQGLGDFAFPCFILAKEIKENPVEIAKIISKELTSDFLEKVEAKGPYINFFISKGNLSSSTLSNIFEGKLINIKEKGKVMIEYSGPNTNKPLHLGHLRNNSLGMAYSNLMEAVGLKVIRANIINDRGIHICKSMLAYQKFANGKTPESEGKKSDHFVGDMYVLYNEKVKENPLLEKEAKELLKKWEENDKETIKLWEKMNKWALDGMKKTYKLFGSEFDEWFFESEFFKKKAGHKLVEEGLTKGVFQKEDNGAVAAILEPEIPNKIIMRGDGTALYATNDLGVTQYRFDKFGIDRCFWVVANEQDLYFKQLFSMFDKLGRKWAKDCHHISYGMVNLTSGKMKSREGTVVDADDIITQVKDIALVEIKKRYSDLDEKEIEKRALAIALSAIKFYLLKNAAKKEITFDPVESLSFEGETGPYLQYSFARAKSILRKANEEGKKYKRENFDLLTHDKEKELVIELGKFSSAVEKSFEQFSLHSIAHNLLGIAEKFNSFYHEVPVLKSDSKELLNARLSLVEATTIVIAKGLEILDIVAIEKM